MEPGLRRRSHRGGCPRGGVRAGASARRLVRDRLDQEQSRASRGGRGDGRTDQGGAVSAASPDPGQSPFRVPEPADPFDDLQLRVAQQLQPWPQTNGEPPRAGVDSFGFGGTNGHAILEAAPETDRAPPVSGDDGRAWMLLLSARSAPALPDLARSYLNALGKEGRLHGEALRDIGFTANAKRSHHEFRLALVAHDQAELVEQLEAYLRERSAAIARPAASPARRRHLSSYARGWGSSGGRWGGSCFPKSWCSAAPSSR